MSRIQGKRWCFTIHASDGGDGRAELLSLYDEMAAPSWGAYGGAQVEVAPGTGRLHIQGFCLFPSNQSLTAVKRIHTTAHWELMRGTLEQSEAYCSKEDSRSSLREPKVWGVRPERPGQGRRTDLEDACDTLAEAEGNVRQRMRAVALAHPAVYAKYSGGLEQLARALQPTPHFNLPQLRVWQVELETALAAAPDDRHILWYTDYTGGAGKSTFLRHYLCKYPEESISLSGKVVDMSYVYDSHRVVFFDVSRTQAEHMDHLYDMAEKLKNGSFLSTKYMSVHKMFDPPHVVFFSNAPPMGGKWSDDRLLHHEITPADREVAPPPPAPLPAEEVHEVSDDSDDEDAIFETLVPLGNPSHESQMDALMATLWGSPLAR